MWISCWRWRCGSNVEASRRFSIRCFHVHRTLTTIETFIVLSAGSHEEKWKSSNSNFSEIKKPESEISQRSAFPTIFFLFVDFRLSLNYFRFWHFTRKISHLRFFSIVLFFTVLTRAQFNHVHFNFSRHTVITADWQSTMMSFFRFPFFFFSRFSSFFSPSKLSVRDFEFKTEKVT